MFIATNMMSATRNADEAGISEAGLRATAVVQFEDVARVYLAKRGYKAAMTSKLSHFAGV
jgi:HJR/Mrr/RecB family endonuclease